MKRPPLSLAYIGSALFLVSFLLPSARVSAPVVFSGYDCAVFGLSALTELFKPSRTNMAVIFAVLSLCNVSMVYAFLRFAVLKKTAAPAEKVLMASVALLAWLPLIVFPLIKLLPRAGFLAGYYVWAASFLVVAVATWLRPGWTPAWIERLFTRPQTGGDGASQSPSH